MIDQRENVLQALAAHKVTICGFGVRRLGLFGSAARGEAVGSSDLDFVVDFEQKSFDGYMRLKFFLEDLFGHKVDRVLIDAIKPRLKRPILDEAVYAQFS